MWYLWDVMVWCHICTQCTIPGGGERCTWLWSCWILPGGQGYLKHWQGFRYSVGLGGGSDLLSLGAGPACCSTVTGSGCGCPVPLGFWGRDIWSPDQQVPVQSTVWYPKPCGIVFDGCFGQYPQSCIDLRRCWGWWLGPCARLVIGLGARPCIMRPTFSIAHWRRRI